VLVTSKYLVEKSDARLIPSINTVEWNEAVLIASEQTLVIISAFQL
jgi:hypothetical protein